MVQKYKCDNMSKVILLNASPRANSNTQIVLEECAREIEAEGVECEIISLRGKRFNPVLLVLNVLKQETVYLMMGLMKS